jgi:hypothetical protein
LSIISALALEILMGLRNKLLRFSVNGANFLLISLTTGLINLFALISISRAIPDPSRAAVASAI